MPVDIAELGCRKETGFLVVPSQALHAIEWPRGFSKDRLLDHADDLFWTTTVASPKPRVGALVLEG